MSTFKNAIQDVVGRTLTAVSARSDGIPTDMLCRNIEVTDSNAAFFDAANGYQGVISGIHEVLRRQGLLDGIWCLNPSETLGPGQIQEIDRVHSAYPLVLLDFQITCSRAKVGCPSGRGCVPPYSPASKSTLTDSLAGTCMKIGKGLLLHINVSADKRYGCCLYIIEPGTESTILRGKNLKRHHMVYTCAVTNPFTVVMI